MTRPVIIAALALAGCSAGRITRDEMIGSAFGHAKISRCITELREHPVFEPVCQAQLVRECQEIKGGNLSTGASELFDNIVTVIGGIFAGGAL